MNYIWLAILGLSLGSFVNALVWRTHEQERVGKGQKVNSKKLSILNGRSMCVHCRHELAWFDLMPVISWLSLGGKCRYCHKPISWQYPIVEVSTVAIFVISYLYFPFRNSLLITHYSLLALWLVVVTGFMALIVYDIRWYLLPNRIVFPLQAIAGLLAIIAITQFPDRYGLIQQGMALLVSAGLFWALHTISGGKWIGYGDVKLGVVIGLVLGRGDLALLMLFLASALGTIVALPLLLRGKANRTTKLPFGPFLMASTMVVFLLGTQIIDWYTSMFLTY